MRQLVLSRFPDEKGECVLSDGEYRYLVNVLRKAEGDVIEGRLPSGSLVLMKITAIQRKEKKLVLSLEMGRGESVSSPATKHGFPEIVLFQWILKGPKMDQVIRQATETGVAFIVPVAGARCLSRDADAVGDGKIGRWERIVREARQQSGSPIATEIRAPLPVAAIPELWKSFCVKKRGIGLLLTEAPLARKSLHEYLVHDPEIIAIAIGPEGGMTEDEMHILADAQFSCIHFRTNILRAETAALYGIAAVQSALTELEKWQLRE